MTPHLATLRPTFLHGAVLLPLLASLLAPLLGCGGGRADPVVAAAPTPVGLPSASAGQLSRFAGLRVIVLPAQSVGATDSLGWRATAGGDKRALALLDSTLADSLGARGLDASWVFPPALQRAAARNPTYVTAPDRLRAVDAVRVALRQRDEPLAEPFAGQLRALAGVSDARYAFVPLELRFDSAPGDAVGGTAGRATLRAAVLDARGSRLVWLGEVSGDARPAYDSSVLASLAQRVADLVVPR